MSTIKEIEVIELHERFSDDGRGVKVVDVRSAAEVARGAIPGAEHIPLHLLPLRINEIPDASMVVLYCHSGARSAQACAYLSAQGKGNVFNLRGGILAWVRNGLKVA